MILKAGTYRFNDVPNVSQFGEYEANFPFISNGYSLNQIWINPLSISYYYFIENGDTTHTFDDVYAEGDGWSMYGEIYQIITLPNDTEVDDTFGTWYIANTNYNEVNATPLATIEYNGQTIAELNAGETATLKCKDLPMASDVVVKIGEVEGGGECSGNHIIEVEELPTSNIETTAVYTLKNAIDVLVYEPSFESFIPYVSFLKQYTGKQGGCYTIPTKTTDNINATGENGFYLYYIVDENDIFTFDGSEWASLGTMMGEGFAFGGFVADISEATDTTRYYALKENAMYRNIGGEWVQYTPPIESVIGTWQFNETLIPSLDLIDEKTVLFEHNHEATIDGVTYTYYGHRMKFEYLQNQLIITDTIHLTEPERHNTPFDSWLYLGGWGAQNPVKLIITSEPNNVAFINWLKANATKQ